MIKSKFSWAETISYGCSTALSFLILKSAGMNILSSDSSIYSILVFGFCITAVAQLIKNTYEFLIILIASKKSES